MSELWCSKPSSVESAQTWGGGAFPVVMGSSSETPVWPCHCLLLFLQRPLCVLDYVWPAVDAFLRAGLGGDLITVLPNCRSERTEYRGEWKESKPENLITLTAFSR